MLIYICPIGSGKVLDIVKNNKKYSGVIGIAQKTPQQGYHYKSHEGVSDKNQHEVFWNVFDKDSFSYLDILDIATDESVYSVGSNIISLLDKILSKKSDITFHFEIAPGYKRIGHILLLITSLRSKHISKITFSDVNLGLVELPIRDIKLTDNEKRVLNGYFKNCDSKWNGKIMSNNYVRNYSGNRKYLYRVYSKCRKLGLMNYQNRVTDLGQLYLEWC